VGIVAQTASLAVLLHRKRLVSLAHIEYAELGRALLAALFAFIAAWGLVRAIPPVSTHPGDVLVIAAGSIAWLIAAGVMLLVTRSKLPRQILRRRKA